MTKVADIMSPGTGCRRPAQASVTATVTLERGDGARAVRRSRRGRRRTVGLVLQPGRELPVRQRQATPRTRGDRRLDRSHRRRDLADAAATSTRSPGDRDQLFCRFTILVALPDGPELELPCVTVVRLADG